MGSVESIKGLGKVLTEGHADELREVLFAALKRLMDAEVSALCGAEYGERNAERTNSRNGYRERLFETRMGAMELPIPKLRTGSYFPSFLDARRRWERAFVVAVAEAYLLGISTRRVDDLVKAMGCEGISKSEVSRMAGELDRDVAAFRNRLLTQAVPYVYVDAIYVKARQDGRVRSMAVLVAYGVCEDGHREVLGAEVAPGEMDAAWRNFLGRLVERGLRGVRLVIADDHAGLKKAVRAVLNGTSYQRCTVHFRRNVLSLLPKTVQGLVAGLLRTVFAQPDRASAKDAMTKALRYLEKYPRAHEVAANGEDDVVTYMDFPSQHWRQLHSTNPLERLNREIRRRTDVVGIFPNEGALERLVASILVEQNDEWAVSRRYFSQESMASLRPEKEVLTLTTAA